MLPGIVPPLRTGCNVFYTPLLAGKNRLCLLRRLGWELDFALVRLGMLPIEYAHVAYHADQLAVQCLRNVLRKLALLLFILYKTNFNEFMVLESLINRGQDLRCKAGLTNLHDGLEVVSDATEIGTIDATQDWLWCCCHRDAF